jgi:hypothetical protein
VIPYEDEDDALRNGSDRRRRSRTPAAGGVRPRSRVPGARVVSPQQRGSADRYGKRVAHRRGAVSGVFKSPLTAEDIAENLNQIMDLNDAQVTESTRSVL